MKLAPSFLWNKWFLSKCFNQISLLPIYLNCMQVVANILSKGTKLREYTKGVENNLRQVELDSIQVGVYFALPFMGNALLWDLCSNKRFNFLLFILYNLCMTVLQSLSSYLFLLPVFMNHIYILFLYCPNNAGLYKRKW